MADVARLAGVSHQTVSRVINGSNSIRPSTRARVERAIADLGYHPNTAARALVTRKSKIIGIIASNTALYGPASIQYSIQEAARTAGYFTSLVTLSAVTHDELRGALEHLNRQSVEAIVMIVTQQDALAVVRSEATATPLIVVEGELSGRGMSVGVDQTAGARLPDVDFDPCGDGTERIGMKFQRQAHAGFAVYSASMPCLRRIALMAATASDVVPPSRSIR